MGEVLLYYETHLFIKVPRDLSFTDGHPRDRKSAVTGPNSTIYIQNKHFIKQRLKS